MLKINFFAVGHLAQCLKITEKVSFNIASEASYIYILSGQKLIKNATNGQFWRVFENLKFDPPTVFDNNLFVEEEKAY